MQLSRKLYRRLNLRAELFIWSIPVPLYMYLVFVGSDTAQRNAGLYWSAGVFALPPTLLLVATLRRGLLAPFLRVLDAPAPDHPAIAAGRRRALAYPLIEAGITAARWVLSSSVVGAIFFALFGLSFDDIFASVICLIALAPASSAAAFFIAENTLAEGLRNERFVQANFVNERTARVGLFPRFLGTTLALALLPFLSLAYLLYLAGEGRLEPGRIVLYISIFGPLFGIVVFVTLQQALQSVMRSLGSIRQRIMEMSAGGFYAFAEETAADEIGLMSLQMNQLIRTVQGAAVAIDGEAAALNGDARRLADSGELLSRNAQEQASSVEEISAAVEQMAASSDNITRNADIQARESRVADEQMAELDRRLESVRQNATEASRNAESAHNRAASGEEILKKSTQAMQAISENTDRIQEAMVLINEVADRVNLLALNASIEAARAGQYGRGFAVVATEVSRLADRTQEQGNAILELVQHAVERVREGMQAIHETSNMFREMIANAGENRRRMDGIVTEIANQAEVSRSVREQFALVQKMAQDISLSLSEQSRTTRELTEGLTRISDATNAITESTEETARLSRGLEARSARLQSEMSFFKIKA